MRLQLDGRLNDKQMEAVNHVDGPLLVFAGAGSGKTRVITYRIANMIANHGIAPNNILSVTFTKKAADEMKERLGKLLGNDIDDGNSVHVGTFHSIGAQILRRHGKYVGLDNNFSIYDGADAQGMLKELMLESGLDVTKFKPKAVYNEISSAKNKMLSAGDYPYHYSGYFEDIVASVYEEYEKHLLKLNAADFADLIYKVNVLFAQEPDVLEYYRNLYKYVLVDEYQDTNAAQYRLIKHLVSEHKNICVVGDDDQSIYKWRGADVKNIISFEKDFPGCTVVKLEQNYRSVANVLHAASSVISKNNVRVDKELWTEKGAGDTIKIYQARDERNEAELVISEIQNYVRSGYSYDDIAILYRTNFQSRILEEVLLKNGISYKLVGGFRFYERAEIKDIISYLRFTQNISDDVSLYRIINTPPRKVGPKTLGNIVDIAKSVDMPVGALIVSAYLLMEGRSKEDATEADLRSEWYSGVEGVLDEMRKYASVVKVFGRIYMNTRSMDVFSGIKYVLKETGYVNWVDDGSDAGTAKKENIQELLNVAQSYAKRYGDDSTRTFLHEINLIEQENEKSSRHSGQGKVTLMTVHASKGLEFPIVFLVGMEEGVFPHSRAFVDADDVEEERRLCYVGITRAQEKLWMSFAETRGRGGMSQDHMPSRFLGEIPEEICEYFSWRS